MRKVPTSSETVIAAGMPLPLTSPITMSTPPCGGGDDLVEVAADFAGRLVDASMRTRVWRDSPRDEHLLNDARGFQLALHLLFIATRACKPKHHDSKNREKQDRNRQLIEAEIEGPAEGPVPQGPDKAQPMCGRWYEAPKARH